LAKLFLIPTPIGNLEDITLRALSILKSCDLILAEDTRTSKFLFSHFGIYKKIYSHHQHNEHQTVEHISERIALGETVALVSDAGTPGISDPGFLLVRACIRKGIEVECLPGPTALIPALVQSGLPCDKFCFEGFLPQKKGRHTRLTKLALEERTLVFYESPFRLVKTLDQLGEYFGKQRQASVSRELTKMYEETHRGTVSELADYFRTKTVKGEIVIVVAGLSDQEESQEEGSDE
jgi:16S rRNA (cytidine1402-2'-O)-methyltransferase